MRKTLEVGRIGVMEGKEYMCQIVSDENREADVECKDCAFDKTDLHCGTTVHKILGACYFNYRSDKESIIYKEIKKSVDNTK